MAYSHHSNDSIATTAIDTIESSKSKVRRIGPKDNIPTITTPVDSLPIVQVQANDSLPSAPVDSVNISQNTASPKVKTQSALDAVVDFTAQDSLVFEAGNLAFLYGKSVVNYQDIQLDAEQIELSLNENTVHAVGRTDSLGETIGKPIYKDSSGEYESETMTYNFKSKRGYITNVITEQGEGYLTGGRTKKTE
ncbi:MAG: hypothetical protein IKK16_00400, partial [Bacteroidaceae bacterium]|nr:hypothetical protein [Bacteroidaceae bacterium]